MQFCTDGPIRTKLATRLSGHSAIGHGKPQLSYLKGGAVERLFLMLLLVCMSYNIGQATAAYTSQALMWSLCLLLPYIHNLCGAQHINFRVA